MKSLLTNIRATSILLAFAMPLTLHAETSAGTDGGINLQTQNCGVYVTVAPHICRNVDDDQTPDSEQYEQWDIDHIPSDGENDLKTITITGTAGPTGGTMTLEILAGGDKINGIFWKDGSKEEQEYRLSWSVPANSSRSETLYIEGYANSAASKDVKFKGTINCPAGTVGSVNYSAASATDFAETAVYEIDLDIDSLNDNGYAAEGYTDDEDRIEASEKEENGVIKPGKVVISGINADTDGDGTPDFADLQSPGQRFVPVRVTLKEPFDPSKAYVRFDYTESKPEESEKGWTVTGTGAFGDPKIHTLHTGGMRLWKKDAASRTAEDFVKPDEDLAWTSIADGNSRTKILYLEYVDKATPAAAGRQTINITASSEKPESASESTSESASEDIATCEDKIVTTLVPMKLNGLDRYVEGRIPMAAMDMIGGISQLSLQFVSSTETHGSFNGLAGAHFYGREEDIASDAEIAAFPGGSLDPRQYDDSAQDTVFWIDNGEMVFATTFDSASAIQVEVIKGGELLGSVGYKLTPNTEFSELINIIDDVLGQIPLGDEPPLLLPPGGQPPALLPALAESVQPSQMLRFGFFDKLLRRNLVTKVAGAVFNKVKEHVVRGAVIVATAAIEAVKTNLIFGQGFVLGLWAGVKEDALAVWDTVKVLYSLTTNPVETCASFRRAFNEMLGITWDEFKQIPGKLIDQFIADSEAKIAWAMPEDGDNTRNLIVYIAGYSTGYITEKVGLAILTGGTSAAISGAVKSANLAAKFVKIIKLVRGGDKLLEAANIAAEAVKAANATKTKLFRRMSQFAKDKTGITTLQKHLDAVIKACPS
jgi:hypothetical protein